MDLADLHSIKRAAEEFQKFITFSLISYHRLTTRRKETKLHVLINNASVFSTSVAFA